MVRKTRRAFAPSACAAAALSATSIQLSPSSGRQGARVKRSKGRLICAQASRALIDICAAGERDYALNLRRGGDAFGERARLMRAAQQQDMGARRRRRMRK